MRPVSLGWRVAFARDLLRFLRAPLLPGESPRIMHGFLVRGGAVWQLVGLITRRSQVQILPPLPYLRSDAPEFAPLLWRASELTRIDRLSRCFHIRARLGILRVTTR